MRQTIKELKLTLLIVFADAKEKHGMRWTTIRGLKKIVRVGDAYYCCHEFEETGYLDLVRCLMKTPRDYHGGRVKI
jgi:hypothetical protein